MHIFEISIFGLQIWPTWYGLMYALGFISSYEFVKKYGYVVWKDMETLLFYIFLGVIIWGRIGYVLLYNPIYFLENPLQILQIWEGGMSFHGGAGWVIIAIFIFAWKYGYKVFDVSDPICTIIPIALGLWRLWNYINQELLGYAPYHWPLAIIKNGESHFPSTLLELCLEWILLLMIMLSWRQYEKRRWRVPWYASAIFLIGYSIGRLIAEQFRLPDSHIGYLFETEWITLGMIYTLPILLWWCAVFLIARLTHLHTGISR